MTLRVFLGLVSVVVPLALWAQQTPPPTGPVYELDQVTRRPMMVRALGFDLPPGFDLRTVRDTVVITYVVDTSGRVDPKSVLIVRPGDPVVRAALIASLRHEVYAPGMVDHTAVAVRLRRQLPMPAVTPAARTPIDSIRARVRRLVGAGPFAVRPLRHRYQRREFCEGYPCGCRYGVWEATTTIPVSPAELDTLHTAFELAPGERFDAMAGYHHVVRPAVVIVFDTMQDYGHRFLPGDTLYLREYTGELSYDVWHRDSVTNVHKFWAPLGPPKPKGALVQAGIEEWWVPIRTVSRRSGWVRLRDPSLVRGPNPVCVPAAEATIW